jgi:RecA/RadA recombinase
MKASGNKYASMLGDSKVLNEKDMFQTSIPALNIALSGSLVDGMNPGVVQIVGESKSFKTLFLLILAKGYLDTYPDSVFLFFDSEHGAAKEYFESIGIDEKRVIHLPITSVEDLKVQLSKILKETERGDKYFIGIDSIGLLASDKEIHDAEDGKSVADMTRAKALNSLFRIVTAQLPLKNIPLALVNHSYDQIGTMYPKKIIKGGTGSYLSANEIWMISRSQEKNNENELEGFKFTINIEKSRKVKEKAKIPVVVTFEHGIDKYSALLDIALAGNFIEKPSNGWYQLKGTDKKVREKDSGPLLETLLTNKEFNKFIEDSYKLTGGKPLLNIGD